MEWGIIITGVCLLGMAGLFVMNLGMCEESNVREDDKPVEAMQEPVEQVEHKKAA